MKKVELLAPAGNMDALKAAVSAGADAVYLGLQAFSARAFAGNLSREEFLTAVQYCHDRSVKIYVTVNTMLFEQEFSAAVDEIDFLYRNSCDGVLVQDMGLFHYIRTCYPDFPVHCSTQMHVHNIAGVRFMKKEGAQRVVLARETPMEIVTEACKLGIEIEVFVYGAICISYSGQCLMSSAMQQRSANKGVCAQWCRLKYYPNKQEHFPEGDYILSPRDLNTLKRVPELIQAGVSSLKIEGRMKRPEYVWYVTHMFRKAIDAYYAGKEFSLSETEERNLYLLFNRNFSEGHLFHAGIEERMSQFRPNHLGLPIGKVLSFARDRVTVRLVAPLYQHDGLRIVNTPHDTGLTAVRIEKNGLLVNEAKAGDIVILDCKSKPVPKPGQTLLKTSDAHLLSEIRKEMATDRKVAVTMEYSVKVGEPLRLVAKDANGNEGQEESNLLCQVPKKAPITKEMLVESLTKTADYPYAVVCRGKEFEPFFLPVKEINETRRRALERLHEARTEVLARAGKCTYAVKLTQPVQPVFHTLVYSEQDRPAGPDEWVVTDEQGMRPVVNEMEKEPIVIQKAVLSNIGDFDNDLQDCIAGMTLNIANSYAIAYFLSKPGVNGVIFTSEASDASIALALDHFEQRYGFVPFSFRLVKGRRVLMYIKNGFRCADTARLVDDAGHTFPVRKEGNLVMILEPEPVQADQGRCWGCYVIEKGIQT